MGLEGQRLDVRKHLLEPDPTNQRVIAFKQAPKAPARVHGAVFKLTDHRAVSELVEFYQNSQICVRGHGGVSKLTELCESSNWLPWFQRFARGAHSQVPNIKFY